MEAWTLDHPELGRIAAEFGTDAEFDDRELDWPKDNNSSKLRLQLSVDGEVVGRYADVRDGRASLVRQKNPLELKDGYMVADRSRPHLKISTTLRRHPIHLEFRRGKEVVELVPPEGSKGASRRLEMQRSPLKRILYPLAAGVGKSGWALAVLLLGPIIGRALSRFLDWLLQFVPDVEITPPHIELPVPEGPEIWLPVPSISMPSLPEVPEWIQVIAEYKNLWMPLLIAVAVAITAVRNHRKSEERKSDWERKNPAPREGEPGVA